ncbi:DUF255 domain-containing protein [Shewanella woodyi]|uniref:DUF255 domain-containing protein n=1 Tax=Shewanella woodyi TaxID=60961 RepID=UPI003749BF25
MFFRTYILFIFCIFLQFYPQAEATEVNISTSIEPELSTAFQARKAWLEDRKVIKGNSSSPQFINQLILSDSPYLLSHSLQPVDWIEWKPEFESDSQSNGKLIFISIGYSTCHWCHVMAEESFADLEIAEHLNSSYINIKVDREQWPLVDERFKSALELLKGEAGWPLNVILTPKGQVIWIDSYLSKAKFSKVIIGLANRWHNKPEAIKSLAARIDKKLKAELGIGNEQLMGKTLSKSEWRALLPKMHQNIHNSLIAEQGSSGPRFFRAYWALGLLDEYLRSGDKKLLMTVESHLDTILLSPVYDMVEGGFHRYAVDGDWQVPHFEKMLYTQANMIRVLAKAYAITDKNHYRIAMEQTSDWVETWLKNDFGYSSAVSALSEGEEGKYYLRAPDTGSQEAGKQLVSIDNLTDDWRDSKAFQQLNESRVDRIKPLIDEKVIVSWNSLYAASLLEAYKVTQEKKFLDRASLLLDSLWLNARKDNQLNRILFHGRASIPAQMEDYAWFASALLKLSFYQAWADEEFENVTKEKAPKKTIEKSIETATQRAVWLLDRLGSKVESGKGDKLTNLTLDGELPSTYAAAFGAIMSGRQMIGKREYKVWLNRLTRFFNPKPQSIISQYSFVTLMADKVKKVNVNQAVFAKGHGKVTLERKQGKLSLLFDMEPGWHVNANPASSERYIATQVSVADLGDVEVKGESFKVNYPKATHKKLDFNDESLALYEGKFEIELRDIADNSSPQKVNIRIQACSDSLCLLPEDIFFFQ